MLLNCGVRLLGVPWTARRSNQSILKKVSPEYSLEGLMLKVKLQYFAHLMRRTDSFEKTLMLVRLKMGGEGTIEDEIVGWHHRLDGWKKSYDQPRQYIKKQTHYFANKGPSTQSYGFSSSHVWM